MYLMQAAMHHVQHDSHVTSCSSVCVCVCVCVCHRGLLIGGTFMDPKTAQTVSHVSLPVCVVLCCVCVCVSAHACMHACVCACVCAVTCVLLAHARRLTMSGLRKSGRGLSHTQESQARMAEAELPAATT